MHTFFNQRDINIHVGINDTPFSYASVDFPTGQQLCEFLKRGHRGSETLCISGDPTRALQYVTVANFRGPTIPPPGDLGTVEPQRRQGAYRIL